jgi:hypothetical protein
MTLIAIWEIDLTRERPVAEFISSFLHFYILIVFIGGVIGYLLLRIREGPNLDPIGLLIAGAVFLVAGFFGTRQLVAYFKIYIYETGIKTYDFMGRYHFARWTAVQSVSYINLILVQYFLLKINGIKPRLWIPLNMTDRNLFARLVLETAGKSHPLTEALKEYLT